MALQTVAMQPLALHTVAMHTVAMQPLVGGCLHKFVHSLVRFHLLLSCQKMTFHLLKIMLLMLHDF
jgi:hypothetical protein